MRPNALRLGLGLAAVCALVLSGRADDKEEDRKETTLKGVICCTRCELNETKVCGNAIKTEIDGEKVTVYFKDEGKKEKYHGQICSAPQAGSVTGELVEDPEVKGKKWIVPSK